MRWRVKPNSWNTKMWRGFYHWDSFPWLQCAVSCNLYLSFSLFWAKFILAFDVRERSLTVHATEVTHTYI
jgi:hypothetical protein